MMTLEGPSLSEADLRRFWAKVALPDENGCMLWLASQLANGYGQFRADATGRTANRIALLIAEGEPPDPRMDAAHSCRDRRCVAPLHLRWATRAENEADKVRDGVSNRGGRHGLSKLALEQVLAIKERYAAGGISQAALGAQYGVSQSTVWCILAGRSWSWVA